MKPTTSYQLTAPARVKGLIQLPASKSISNRALILHALACHEGQLTNLSDCDDTRVLIEALQGKPHGTIDIGAAGTAMRFLTAYQSITPGSVILTGSERMQQRPIGLLVDALRALGADIQYRGNEGFPPLQISGRELKGGAITLPGSVSSQYISALLMIAPLLQNGLQLELTGAIISRPYIDLTLQLMQAFGATAQWSGERCIRVSSGSYRRTDFTIESDWSAASYWYQLAALSPNASITLQGLFTPSRQGDSRGAALFARLGVATTWSPAGLCLQKTALRCERLDEDFSDIPDLAQTFAVTCALLGVPFRFTGVQSLKIKETDRIAALQTELQKLGYLLREENGCLLSWEGERCPPHPTPVIATYEDHRMAMAFAPASLLFPQLQIANPHVVSKSYPTFWSDLEAAGFGIRSNA